MNSKITNNINSIKYLKKDIKPKLTKYFDEVTSLYAQRKIEKQASMMKIINLLRQGKRDEAKKLIKKYRKYNPVTGIKAKGVVFNEARRMHTYHMQVNIKVQEHFTGTDKTYIVTFTESKVIQARNLKEAQRLYKNDIKSRYNMDDSAVSYKLISIEFLSMLNINDEVVERKQIKYTRMRAASIANVDYDHIIENKQYLQNNNMCVIDNVVGYFEKEFKITKDKFINMCSDYYNKIDNVEYDDDDDNVVWRPEDGISPACIQWFCEQKNISHSR